MYLSLDIAEKSDLPDMFEIIDQILNYSIYDPKLVDSEREVVMAEQTKKKASPDQYINDLQSSLLFQNTEIENSVLGTEITIKETTRNDLYAYYNKYLKNGQVSYFIAGDFNKKYVFDTLEKINQNRLPILLSKEVLPAFQNNKQLIIPSKTEQNYISLCFRLTPIEDNKEKVACLLLNTILGLNNTSRLMKKLRGEKSLVYNVSASIFNNVEYAYLGINTNCKTINTSEVISIIKEEMSKLVKDGIEQKEFELARRGIIRNLKFNYETVASWVDNLAMNNLALNKYPLLPDEIIEILNSITVENIHVFIEKYLTTKELLLAGIGDFSSLKV